MSWVNGYFLGLNRIYWVKPICPVFPPVLGLRIHDSYDAKIAKKNLQPLDISAFNSANKPSYQNPPKSLFAQCSIDARVKTANPASDIFPGLKFGLVTVLSSPTLA